MATHITKRCPKCGSVISFESYAHSPSKANRTKYGSPIRECNHCGNAFKDDEYREIAVEGIRKVDTSLVSPYSILFGILGVIIGIGSFRGGLSIGWALVVVFIFCFSPLSDILSYRKRMEYFERERIASENRLRNPVYAHALKSMGYDVPEKYLIPYDQTQSATQTFVDETTKH